MQTASELERTEPASVSDDEKIKTTVEWLLALKCVLLVCYVFEMQHLRTQNWHWPLEYG